MSIDHSLATRIIANAVLGRIGGEVKQMASTHALPDVYQREDGLWDWRLFADNGEQVCESHQGYTRRSDAIRGFNTTRTVMGLVTPIQEPEETEEV